MKLSAIRMRSIEFLQKNMGMCIICLFLFVAGLAAGMHIAAENAQEISIFALGEVLHKQGISWLYCVLMSLSIYIFILSMLILSGVLLPAAFLWPFSIFTKSVLLGIFMELLRASLPSGASIALLLLLLIKTALLLPSLLYIAAISKQQILLNIKKLFFPQTKLQHTPASCAYHCLKSGLSFLPCVLLDAFIIPMAIYLFT